MKKDIDNEFFKTYNNGKKGLKGIPRLFMNKPLGRVNAFPGSIGLELELEGQGLLRDFDILNVMSPKTMANWHGVADGSLRGESLEYILTAPIHPEELEGMLKGLFDTFKNAGTRIMLSNRCSTHVHINVGGKKVNTITSIIALWTVFEEALINWCGEERKTNHFALSSKDSIDLMRVWNRFLQQGGTEWGREMKYSALNILPVIGRGSVEFRCGPGVDEWSTPYKWALGMHKLVEYANKTFVNPQRIAIDISERGGLDIFRDMMQDHDDFLKEVTEPYTRTEFDELALAGFRRCQSICMQYPWDEWLPLIDKEYVPNPFEKTKKATEDIGEIIEQAIHNGRDPLIWQDAPIEDEVEALAPAPEPARPGRVIRPRPILADRADLGIIRQQAREINEFLQRGDAQRQAADQWLRDREWDFAVNQVVNRVDNRPADQGEGEE